MGWPASQTLPNLAFSLQVHYTSKPILHRQGPFSKQKSNDVNELEITQTVIKIESACVAQEDLDLTSVTFNPLVAVCFYLLLQC